MSATASTRAGIPDDKLVICSIVASFLAAPDPQLTLADMTRTVIQLLVEKGYRHRAILVALRRLENGYYAPE
jgi:hypothetical protein